MGAVLLSIGDEVEPGQYALHSRFERACNFLRGERLVCVVEEDVGAGPLNIVLASSCQGFPSSLYVGSDCIIAGAWRMPFGKAQRYPSELQIPHFDPQRLFQNVSILGEALMQSAPAASLVFLMDKTRTAGLAPGFTRTLAQDMARSAAEFFHGDLFAGIAGLKGCGPGLTPSGDDFLAGVLIGLHVVEQICREDFRDLRSCIFAAAAGDNLFSNNFLAMARRGKGGEHLQALITALIEGSKQQVELATRKMLAMGSTSGADFATGLCLTIRDEGKFAARYRKLPGAVVRPISSGKVQVATWS